MVHRTLLDLDHSFSVNVAAMAQKYDRFGIVCFAMIHSRAQALSYGSSYRTASSICHAKSFLSNICASKSNYSKL
mgnify:CR=1 FL=1